MSRTTSSDTTLQRAIAAANQGETSRALRMVRKHLDRAPKDFNARHLLGVLELQRERYTIAARELSRATALRPNNAAAQSNLALARRHSGDAEGAREPAAVAYRQAPERVEFAANYVNLLNQLEEFSTAATVAREALTRHDDARLYYPLGQALVSLGEAEAAIEAFEAALDRRPDHTDTRLELGIARALTGDREGAIADHRGVLERQPDHASAWHNLVHVLETDDARIGEMLVERVERTPEMAAAWADLAAYEERGQRLEQSRRAVERALHRDPAHFHANLTRARLDRREGRTEAALNRLERLNTDHMTRPHIVEFERAFALDELGGREDEVWATLQRANAASSAAAHGIDSEQFPAERVAIADRFTEDWIASWEELPAPRDDMDPIFLGGFPRSGTTLLGNMLHGHQGLYDLEERPLIDPLLRTLRHESPGYPDSLAELTAASRDALRQQYRERLAAFAPGTDGIEVINRNPICPVYAGLFSRLFPQHRFIFIMRDPADVCLSCFMQNFRIHPVTVQFTDPVRTAFFYAECMRAWEIYRTRLPLNVHEVRYEDLIDNPEPVLRDLLAFLELEWDPSVLSHADTARSRGRGVRTASYQQVTHGLYRHSSGRWRRYQAHMDKMLRYLEPWRAHFGYT